MRTITTLAAITGLAALSACGGNDAEENTDATLEANTLVVENLEAPAGNMTMDMNGMDMNATTDVNATVDTNTTTTTTNTTTNTY